jgi:TetR/AcrR family transcriptional repressor of nem operon
MTIIMQGEANAKAQKKQASRERILRSAAAQLRSMGIDGASVSSIMEAAGLTHGGFYAHFEDKLDLINAAFAYAMDSSREQWLKNLDPADHEKVLETMIKRYLSRDHRDHPEHGCPLPALAADMALHREDTAETVEACIQRSIEVTGRHVRELEGAPPKEAEDLTIALFSLCVGGVLISRAVESPEFSNQILRACRRFARTMIRQ